MIWQGKLVETGMAAAIVVEAGNIIEVRPLEAQASGLPWISAGWIDLQVNGFGGYDLNGPVTTAEDVEGVTRALHKRGVASYLPTVITGHHDRMRQALAAIADYRRSGKFAAGSIAGIHMEGPYLSGEDGSRGAHPREHIRNPDWDEFMRLQEAADGLISMVTLAPEREGAIPFIRRLAENGIVVAIGHTMATGEQIEQAVAAGAALSTHLGNGSQPLLPRHPNYIWHQLAEDRLWATFIPDGHHLAPPVLKSMLRVKGNKSILVSDCTQFGGMAPGKYDSLIGGKVELTEEGRLHTVANPSILAGSAASLDIGVENAVRYTDMGLEEAIEAITLRPAQAMGQAESGMGRIAIGHPAHLTLFRYDAQPGRITVQETVVSGESVYRLQP
ncbi:N-acetylglucosamine-6-phosphate deacetylase [Paenibacillus sp. UNCCL117]|uniref:N-acetylglucosamine-6-phosphate deacetylase n=1 Tax=unclassified Paenibacillus TaxID=185978 RepID=UPI00088B583E|nr:MULTISPECIES: amidohydrolase family protein [unclassified Paenibacillus]SDC66954.1 N-acetylglucosamine-6-phosphate deacetylase [Paenibacillus sp. cl123]SFW23181.1 N-acetylglucosamine-6-phosphate deacetylase [Paenibacillus sp. UNCCL117]